MPSIFDQFIALGEQSSYATAAAPTHGYDARSDDWQVESQPVSVEGYRIGAQAIPVDQYRTIIKGASGSVETAWFTRGMGLILKHLLGVAAPHTPAWVDLGVDLGAQLNASSKAVRLSAAPSGFTLAAGDVLRIESEILIVESVTSTTNITVLRGAYGTTAASHGNNTDIDISRVWTAKYQTDDTGPKSFYTIQVSRVGLDNANYLSQYEGCVATGFNLEASVDGGLMLTVNFDAREENLNATNASVAYTDGEPYVWEDVAVRVGGQAVETVTSFSLEGDLGMRTDRYYLLGSSSKSEPKRNARPAYTGTIEADLVTLTDNFYRRFLDGEVLSLELEATYPEVIPGTSTKPSVLIRIPAIRFTGSTPTSSVEESTTVSLPFTAFWNGTDPVLEISVSGQDSTW